MSAALAIPKGPAQALVDAHSPVHFTVGFTAGVLGIDPHLALMAFIGARIVESALGEGLSKAIATEQRRSLGKELTNILLEVAGVYYGKTLRTRLAEPPAPAVAGLGIDYYDPLTHRYEDYMSYPRIR